MHALPWAQADYSTGCLVCLYGMAKVAMGDHMHQLPQELAEERSTRVKQSLMCRCHCRGSTNSLDLAAAPWAPSPRNGFRHITATCAELVGILHAAGPGAAVDMDQACLCETMDVIGLFGFGQGFQAVKCAISPKPWLDLGIRS